MRRWLAVCGIGIGLLVAFGCAKPKVWQPPRLDLRDYGTLGLIEIGSEDDHGPLATRQLLSTLHAAQAGVPVLEIGPLRPLLRAVGHETLDPEAVRAIGEKHRVDALLMGDLRVDELRPSFSVHSFTQANARAEIEGTLTTRILDARSGATVWSNEARGKRTVASLDVNAGSQPRFGAADPQAEHTELVRWLVERVTGDFRGRWVRP